MKPSIETDRQLLSDVLSGSQQASESLVRQFSDPVYKTIQWTLMAKNVTFTRHDLEDLHNTVFLNLFDNQCKKLQQYEGRNGCSLFSWIRMITVRTVLDHLRIKSLDGITSKKNLIPLDQLAELKDMGTGVLAQIEKNEQRKLLSKAMEGLVSRDRLFLRLHIEEGFSISKAAKTMKLSLANAYTLKHRVIQKLKHAVETVTNNKRQGRV